MNSYEPRKRVEWETGMQLMTAMLVPGASIRKTVTTACEGAHNSLTPQARCYG
jgi:hypothetical protein